MFTWVCSSLSSQLAQVNQHLSRCQPHITCVNRGDGHSFPSLRSEAEHFCRERLPSPPLLSQGPQLSIPGCGPLGRAFHRGSLRRTLQRRRGSGREVIEVIWLVTIWSSMLYVCWCVGTAVSNESVLVRLVKVTCYGSQTSLYELETAVPSVLKPDLIDV